MVNKAAFMAVVAGNDLISVTDKDSNVWTGTVIAVMPDADHDLLVQEPGNAMLTLYTISETEQLLHIEGKGDF